MLLFICCSNIIWAQFTQGKVIDQNEDPIAFATILMDADPSKGYIADINGEFQIPNEFEFIEVSAIGYRTIRKLKVEIREKTLSASDERSRIVIKLEETTYELITAEVVAGENLANEIIRRAVQNKSLNDPQELAAYTCKIYNKLVGDFFDPKNKIDSIPPKGKIALRIDSLFRQRADFFFALNEDRHMFLMESLVTRKFKQPKHLLETIEHNRISGLNSPSFSAIIHSLQPFSFYQNYVEVLDKNFLNPISPQSEDQYFFNLEDTLYQGKDSIYIISFRPKKGKIFDGLTGVLNIHSSKYALQAIKAKPSKPGAMQLNLEQLYQPVDGQWFPSQLNIEIEADKYPSPHIGTKFSGKSYIDQIEINPILRGKDFPLDGTELAPESNDRSDSLWQSIRTIDLSPREALTYQWLDSLGAEKKIDKKLKIFDALIQGRFKFGLIDWNVPQTFKSNQVEGFRPGIRLETNKQFSKIFQLGGYIGYGLRDKNFKYNADLNFNIFPRRKGILSFYYKNDVLEPARFELDQPGELLTSRLYATRLDYTDYIGAKFSTYFLPYTWGSIHLERQFFDPSYVYSFLGSENDNSINFDIVELGISLRYAFAEKHTELFGTRVRTESSYPSIQITANRGLNIWSGQYEYLQLKAGIEGSFRIRKLGLSSFSVFSGWVDSGVPIAKLFSTPGLDNDFDFLIEEPGFRTLEPYEFLADRFVFLFFKQELGTLLNVHKFFRPTFSIEQNMGWGNLDQPNNHIGPNFKTMNKGYFETGLLIENILSLNYFSLGYIGLGIGGWYNYGPYAADQYRENFSFKLTLNFDFL